MITIYSVPSLVPLRVTLDNSDVAHIQETRREQERAYSLNMGVPEVRLLIPNRNILMNGRQGEGNRPAEEKDQLGQEVVVGHDGRNLSRARIFCDPMVDLATHIDNFGEKNDFSIITPGFIRTFIQGQEDDLVDWSRYEVWSPETLLHEQDKPFFMENVRDTSHAMVEQYRELDGEESWHALYLQGLEFFAEDFLRGSGNFDEMSAFRQEHLGKIASFIKEDERAAKREILTGMRERR